MNTKHNTIAATKLLLLVLLGLFFSSCKKEAETRRDDSQYIRLKLDIPQAQMRANSEATPDEKQVIDLVVLFFNETSGEIFDVPFQFDASKVSDKTMLIPLKPEEVNKKRVVVIANLDGKGNLKEKLQAKAITNYSELTNLLYESATEAKCITAPSLLMQGEVIHTFTTTDKVATVALRRAVAKLTVKVYLKWKALDARFPTSAQPRAFNLYQLRDVSRDTHLMELAPKVLNKSNRSERYNDNSVHSEPLWPFGAHTQKQGPLDFIAYINEYDQGREATNVPPYVYLKLHANVPESKDDNGGGVYPPPAGGEIIPAHEADFYYRLLLPRQVKRNSHYLVEAHILSAGSKDASMPLDVATKITLSEWKEVSSEATGESEIYN